jgi:hypothetical protein
MEERGVRAPVIVDEYAPGLFRYLKAAVDADQTRKGQFLLTGSQKFTLMKSTSASLAGRADTVELETLSLAEIRNALPPTLLESTIVRGGFVCPPQLVLNQESRNDPVFLMGPVLSSIVFS